MKLLKVLDALAIDYPFVRVSLVLFNHYRELLDMKEPCGQFMYGELKIISFPHTSKEFETELLKQLELW